MNNNFNTPAEVIEANINGGVKKANLSFVKLILLGIWAGGFVALGANTSSVAAHGISNVGLARTLAGTIFPVGLIMIILIGGELFTGNGLIVMAVLDKKTTWKKMIRNLFLVYLANLVGSLVIVFLTSFSGQLDYSDGLLGAYTIKVALGKTGITFLKGVTSGILCNVLVCLAILVAASARDTVGKIWACFFPIFAFVIGGFEHCVANMYYIPAGILAASNPAYVSKAAEAYGITADQCASLNAAGMLNNLIPVTLGNLIGGIVCVGLMAYAIYIKESHQK